MTISGREIIRRAAHLLDYATGGVGAVACAHDGLPYYGAHAMLGERLAQRGLPWLRGVA